MVWKSLYFASLNFFVLLSIEFECTNNVPNVEWPFVIVYKRGKVERKFEKKLYNLPPIKSFQLLVMFLPQVCHHTSQLGEDNTRLYPFSSQRVSQNLRKAVNRNKEIWFSESKKYIWQYVTHKSEKQESLSSGDLYPSWLPISISKLKKGMQLTETKGGLRVNYKSDVFCYCHLNSKYSILL